jgi:hypothetical protein
MEGSASSSSTDAVQVISVEKKLSKAVTAQIKRLHKESEAATAVVLSEGGTLLAKDIEGQASSKLAWYLQQMSSAETKRLYSSGEELDEVENIVAALKVLLKGAKAHKAKLASAQKKRRAGSAFLVDADGQALMPLKTALSRRASLAKMGDSIQKTCVAVGASDPQFLGEVIEQLTEVFEHTSDKLAISHIKAVVKASGRWAPSGQNQIAFEAACDVAADDIDVMRSEMEKHFTSVGSIVKAITKLKQAAHRGPSDKEGTSFFKHVKRIIGDLPASLSSENLLGFFVLAGVHPAIRGKVMDSLSDDVKDLSTDAVMRTYSEVHSAYASTIPWQTTDQPKPKRQRPNDFGARGRGGRGRGGRGGRSRGGRGGRGRGSGRGGRSWYGKAGQGDYSEYNDADNQGEVDGMSEEKKEKRKGKKRKREREEREREESKRKEKRQKSDGEREVHRQHSAHASSFHLFPPADLSFQMAGRDPVLQMFRMEVAAPRTSGLAMGKRHEPRARSVQTQMEESLGRECVEREGIKRVRFDLQSTSDVQSRVRSSEQETECFFMRKFYKDMEGEEKRKERERLGRMRAFSGGQKPLLIVDDEQEREGPVIGWKPGSIPIVDSPPPSIPPAPRSRSSRHSKRDGDRAEVREELASSSSKEKQELLSPLSERAIEQYPKLRVMNELATDLPTVPVMIKNKRLEARVDTQSHISCIDRDWAEQNGLTIYSDRLSTRKIRLGGKVLVRTLGSVYSNVSVGRHTRRLRLDVIDWSSDRRKMLLGWDSLPLYGIGLSNTGRRP